MAWTVAATLAALLLLQFSLFWRTLREQREMTRFLMLVLADEQSHAHWKEELKKLVAVTETKNAIDLHRQVMHAMTRTAATIKDATFTASHGLLWKMKAGDKAI